MGWIYGPIWLYPTVVDMGLASWQASSIQQPSGPEKRMPREDKPRSVSPDGPSG